MKRIWFILIVLLVFIGIVSAVQLGISGGQAQRPPAQAPEPLRQEAGKSPSSGIPAAPEAEKEGGSPSAGKESLPAPEDAAEGDAASDPLQAPDARAEAAPPAGDAVKHGTVEKGDTLSTVLESVSTEGSFEYANAVKQVFSLRAFRAGQPYVVVTDNATGRIKAVDVTYSDKTAGTTTVTCRYGSFKPLGRKAFPSDITLTMKSNAVKKGNNMSVNIAISDIDTSDDWETFTQVSGKYRQVSVKDVMNRLLKM